MSKQINADTVGFGRRISPDSQDGAYLMRANMPLRAAPLPTKKLWGFAGPPLDQGNTGTCVGHGWAGFLHCKPVVSKLSHDTAVRIYREAILVDEYPENDSEENLDFDQLQGGTSVRAGAKALTKAGRLKSYVWAFHLQEALQWVLTQGPVVLGTDWYDSMFKLDSKNVARISPQAVVSGGHCFLWIGADTQTALAECVNSWGPTFGKNGRFFIPFTDLERLIVSQGEVCAAVQKSLKAKTEGALPAGRNAVR